MEFETAMRNHTLQALRVDCQRVGNAPILLATCTVSPDGEIPRGKMIKQ